MPSTRLTKTNIDRELLVNLLTPIALAKGVSVAVLLEQLIVFSLKHHALHDNPLIMTTNEPATNANQTNSVA